MSKRTFLFLQGLASPFFYRLARRLRAAGHDVLRINLSGADMVFWPERAINFRGSAQDWPDFVAQVMRDRHVTDLVLFGDCRPYHRVALQVARQGDAVAHIFEEGYIRPNWITLEHGGTNGYSAIPRDPHAIRALAEQLPEPRQPVELHASFFTRSLWDVTANILGALLWPLFPHYRWHGTEHPFLEYAGWVRRLARRPASSRRARKTIAHLVDGGLPYFLVPLQLHSDYQIRVHSPYSNPVEAIEEIIASFVGHAASDAHLLFKLHPLDNSLFDYPGKIAQAARRFGATDRVHVIDDSDLPKLLTHSSGVVLVNSSMGTLALEHGYPVKALGTATYDMPGLTFQGPLDEFWANPTPPDDDLYRAYRRVVLALTQVNGGFFNSEAIGIGTRLVADRMLATSSGIQPSAALPQHGAFVLDMRAIVPGE